LECEIEPFPTPSSEAVAEASGFAKVSVFVFVKSSTEDYMIAYNFIRRSI
jgi:hypothetical protein